MWWPLIAPLSGMAADAGDHWFVYVFIWSVLTYPLSVGIAFVFKRKFPAGTLLPLVNVVLCLVSGSYP